MSKRQSFDRPKICIPYKFNNFGFNSSISLSPSRIALTFTLNGLFLFHVPTWNFPAADFFPFVTISLASFLFDH